MARPQLPGTGPLSSQERQETRGQRLEARKSRLWAVKDFFLQKKGVEMGTCFAPDIAPVVASSETRKIMCPTNPYGCNVIIRWRDIDSIFLTREGDT
ncbi:hypothetical protein NDU88_000660 [Pleurodeles waltl]|uniref:Uncharacterized protein n=1 Tax=Pleurodeles waltl TaxID=8319 RepID=A0AAV7LWG4_PLEWA|nr:hypothetical protein NDU88_000660 [Pleurodeles waltl]